MGNIIYFGEDNNTSSVDSINSFLTSFCESLVSLAPDILTLTSDTGQHQWGSLTSLPSTSTSNSFAWNVFKFDDGHGAIYIKFEYMRAISYYQDIAIRMTCGKGSDGAGNITQVFVDRFVACPIVTTDHSSNPYLYDFYKNRMVCVEGFFAMSLLGERRSERTARSNLFAISRPVDSSGVVVDNRLVVYTTSINANAGSYEWGSSNLRQVYNLDTLSLYDSTNLSSYYRGYHLTGLFNLNFNGETRYSRMMIRAPEFLFDPNLIISRKSGADWDTPIKPEGNGGPVFVEWGCFGDWGQSNASSNSFTCYVRWE